MVLHMIERDLLFICSFLFLHAAARNLFPSKCRFLTRDVVQCAARQCDSMDIGKAYASTRVGLHLFV
jgi:hypothetical protein